jgi:hypothetical protein
LAELCSKSYAGNNFRQKYRQGGQQFIVVLWGTGTREPLAALGVQDTDGIMPVPSSGWKISELHHNPINK